MYRETFKMLKAGGLGLSHIKKKCVVFSGCQCVKHMSSCSLAWFQIPFSPNKGEISVFIWPPVFKEGIFILKGLNPRVTFFLGLCVTLWYLLKLAVVLVARTEAMVGILRSQQF